MIQDYRTVVFMTAKKAAFLGALGYACDHLNSYRVDITVLQILSLRGSHVEYHLYKFLGGGRLTMNRSLQRLVAAGYITFSMKPTKHETGIGIHWKPRKTYKITPDGRLVLLSMAAYIDLKMDEVRRNPKNTQFVTS